MGCAKQGKVRHERHAPFATSIVLAVTDALAFAAGVGIPARAGAVPVADLSERLRAALADRYTIERSLGSGGMATVYLAEDLNHHRRGL